MQRKCRFEGGNVGNVGWNGWMCAAGAGWSRGVFVSCLRVTVAALFFLEVLMPCIALLCVIGRSSCSVIMVCSRWLWVADGGAMSLGNATAVC